MKNIAIKSFSVLSALLVLATGCIKETFPQGSTQTAAQVAKSDGALDAMINAIPVSMMGTNELGYYSNYGVHWDYGIGAIHMASELMLEDMATLGDNPYYNRYYAWAYNQNQGDRYIYCAYFWDAYYTWIKAANDIINVVDPEDMNDTAKKYLGQALAYRASFYLDLARYFEPLEPGVSYSGYDISKVKGLTVPLVDENTTEEDGKNNPRVSHDEMYAFILNDLDRAAEYLKDVKTDYSHPSINLVNGLYARTYLEMGAAGTAGAYEKAAQYARKVIDESGKTPLTQAQWEDPKTGFNSGSSNNSWIWGLTLSTENQGNILTWAAHICSEGAWGYAPLSQLGMNKATYEKIPDTDFRKHSWLDPGRMNYYNYQFSCGDDSYLNATGAYRGNPVPKDLVNIKFRPAQGEVSDYAVGNCTDQVLMRIEEMYFIEAEALAQTDVAGAKAVLESLVKTRNPQYTCTASTKEAFLEEMLFQKRVEFWGEGILFFDYKRLGAGITRGYKGTNHAAVYAYNSVGRSPQWNIVITRGEHQANTGITADTNNPDPSDLLPLWSE